jgi:hypothetical protein
MAPLPAKYDCLEKADQSINLLLYALQTEDTPSQVKSIDN